MYIEVKGRKINMEKYVELNSKKLDKWLFDQIEEAIKSRKGEMPDDWYEETMDIFDESKYWSRQEMIINDLYNSEDEIFSEILYDVLKANIIYYRALANHMLSRMFYQLERHQKFLKEDGVYNHLTVLADRCNFTNYKEVGKEIKETLDTCKGIDEYTYTDILDCLAVDDYQYLIQDSLEKMDEIFPDIITIEK